MKKATPHFCEITNDKLFLIRSRKRISLKEIVMLRGEINYTSIHLLSGKVLIVPRTIKIFENLLSSYAFIRTHRAYLVNEYHLQEFDLHKNCVKLTNNMTALISRRRKEAFEHFLD
ncbi:LytR/AlgR family response regulator transcription factor [Arcicella aurantiaca]|nr:LytTR family DNA-binding domain-containing protein [Arcicella aurantiaca]